MHSSRVYRPVGLSSRDAASRPAREEKGQAAGERRTPGAQIYRLERAAHAQEHARGRRNKKRAADANRRLVGTCSGVRLTKIACYEPSAAGGKFRRYRSEHRSARKVSSRAVQPNAV